MSEEIWQAKHPAPAYKRHHPIDPFVRAGDEQAGTMRQGINVYGNPPPGKQCHYQKMDCDRCQGRKQPGKPGTFAVEEYCL